MDIKRMLQTVAYCILPTSTQRGNYIRKKNIFGMVGDNVYLPFMILPLRCENIFLHNNIEIASGVKLIPHDAIHGVFNRMNDGFQYEEHIGKIEIMDNVFIGTNSTILGPCKIGPNVIVAAGAVVCEDIPPGTIVGGVPAKKIGEFDKLKEKRRDSAKY